MPVFARRAAALCYRYCLPKCLLSRQASMYTGSNFTIRPATVPDFDAVMNIDPNIYSGNDALYTKYTDYMRDPKYFCTLAEVKERVVSI